MGGGGGRVNLWAPDPGLWTELAYWTTIGPGAGTWTWFGLLPVAFSLPTGFPITFFLKSRIGLISGGLWANCEASTYSWEGLKGLKLPTLPLFPMLLKVKVFCLFLVEIVWGNCVVISILAVNVLQIIMLFIILYSCRIMSHYYLLNPLIWTYWVSGIMMGFGVWIGWIGCPNWPGFWIGFTGSVLTWIG